MQRVEYGRTVVKQVVVLYSFLFFQVVQCSEKREGEDNVGRKFKITTLVISSKSSKDVRERKLEKVVEKVNAGKRHEVSRDVRDFSVCHENNCILQ